MYHGTYYTCAHVFEYVHVYTYTCTRVPWYDGTRTWIRVHVLEYVRYVACTCVPVILVLVVNYSYMYIVLQQE